MNKAIDIFIAGNLVVARGESHTTGERQFRITIDRSSLRLPSDVAVEMAKEIIHWAAVNESEGTDGR